MQSCRASTTHFLPLSFLLNVKSTKFDEKRFDIWDIEAGCIISLVLAVQMSVATAKYHTVGMRMNYDLVR